MNFWPTNIDSYKKIQNVQIRPNSPVDDDYPKPNLTVIAEAKVLREPRAGSVDWGYKNNISNYHIWIDYSNSQWEFNINHCQFSVATPKLNGQDVLGYYQYIPISSSESMRFDRSQPFHICCFNPRDFLHYQDGVWYLKATVIRFLDVETGDTLEVSFL